MFAERPTSQELLECAPISHLWGAHSIYCISSRAAFRGWTFISPSKFISTGLFHGSLLGLIGGANWELLGWIPSCRVRGSSVKPE